MPQTPIELKGSSFTLTVVHLYQSPPEVLRKALQEKIAQAPAFLKNAPVVLNVAALNGTTDWSLLQKTISDTGLKIVGISGCNDADLKHQLQQHGLPVLNEGKTRAVKRQVSEQAVPEPVVQAEIAVAELSGFSKTRVITTPVRSGQQIYARHSDLIVTSSVSAGAELVADGNIHIYGMMRGRALAGAGGDKSAQIFCINLAAELVSVAGEYWIMDQIPAEYFGKAARLSLVDGRLAIESLS